MGDSSIQKEFQVLKNLEADVSVLVKSRGELEAQFTETRAVMVELDLLQDDAAVFKSMGPVLLKQDVSEAKSMVNNRVEFIKKELGRVAKAIEDLEAKQDAQKEKLIKIQQEILSKRGPGEQAVARAAAAAQ